VIDGIATLKDTEETRSSYSTAHSPAAASALQCCAVVHFRVKITTLLTLH